VPLCRTPLWGPQRRASVPAGFAPRWELRWCAVIAWFPNGHRECKTFVPDWQLAPVDGLTTAGSRSLTTDLTLRPM
jgi:hypothetical protein